MGTFICRTYAKAAVACGSMVLFFFCRSLFRPGGRNKDLQRVRNSWFASVLISWVLHCSLCERTIKHKNGTVRQRNSSYESEVGAIYTRAFAQKMHLIIRLNREYRF